MANLGFRVYAKHSDTCDCTPTNRCAFYRSEWDRLWNRVSMTS
jgi:hypothetical protein